MTDIFTFTNKLPKNAQVDLEIIEFGGIQRGSLGGPDTYVKRTGDRFQATITLPTMEKDFAGDWIGNRAFGYSRGGYMCLELPQFVPIDEAGSPLVVPGAGTAGAYVYLDQATSGLYKNGQLFSYYSTVNRFNYLHMVTEFRYDMGYPMISISPPLRDNPVGAYLEFGAPIIQGFITGLKISVTQRRFVGQQFVITEGR